ncbi:MAG: hypothetical protein V1873_02035 [Verrucomicrobiota bacterium]
MRHGRRLERAGGAALGGAGTVAGLLSVLFLCRAAGAGGPAASWSWSFNRPLQATEVMWTNVTWSLNVDGNTALSSTSGAAGYVMFTNIAVNLDTHPILELDAPGAQGHWTLEAGLHGSSLSNVHASVKPGAVSVNLSERFGWTGAQSLDLRVSCSNRVELRELSLSVKPGWVLVDGFDTHHWEGEFQSLFFGINPHVTNNGGWIHPCTGTYSTAHPVEGETALRVSAPIVPGDAANFAYLKAVLPEPEDWSNHRFLTFDGYVEQAPLIMPSGGLVLRNDRGEENHVTLILGWQMFEWENRQTTFPLQGNMMKGVQNNYTNWEIRPIPGSLLTNVTEVTVGFEYYSDPELQTNFVHLDNMRLDSVRMWDAFEGPEYGWHGTNPAVRTGISGNRTLSGSAGALCIRWTNSSGRISADTRGAAREDNWSSYAYVKAHAWADQTNTRVRLVVNGTHTTTVAAVGTTGTWNAIAWNRPAGVTSVSNLAFEIVDPPAEGRVYIDQLMVGAYPSRIESVQALALRDRNRLTWSLSDTAGVKRVRVVCNTNALPTGPSDGTVVLDQPPGSSGDFSFDHEGVSAGVVYHYAVFTQYDDDSFSPVTADAAAEVSRDFLALDGGGYEAAFSKVNGALLYLYDRGTGRTLSYGNEALSLWRVVFVHESIPAIESGWFSPEEDTLKFSYTQSPLTLRYSYLNGTQSLDVAVTVDTWSTNRLVLRVGVSNHTAEAIRRVGAPRQLLFAITNINGVVFPVQEGVRLTREYFEKGHYMFEPRPWLFADFIGLDSSDGLLSFYAIQDSTYEAELFPRHDPARPMFQPCVLGVGAAMNTRGMAIMDYDAVTYIPPGGHWTSPALVLETGGGSTRDAVASYKQLNSFNDTNLFPTLQQKLDAFGWFDRIARAPVLTIECELSVDWQKAPQGRLWQTIENEWVNVLPRDSILHFTHWQEGTLEDRHPDSQPIVESKFGSTNDLIHMLAALHQTNDWLVMPFCDWLVWNKPEDLVYQDGKLVPRPESCTKVRSPDTPLLDYRGYMVKPWHTNVWQANTNLMGFYTTNQPVDLMFMDMTCERSWRYTRVDQDANGVDDRIVVGYTQGVIDENHELKRLKPIFTEGLFDRMMGEVSGYCGSLRQKRLLDWLAHMGNEFEDWVVYPLAADVAHLHVGFYQHNLNTPVFPDRKLLLTHYTLMGYGYLVDVAHWYKENNERGENWMYICDAFQKAVAAKYFGKPLSAYVPAAGGDPRVIQMSYGSGPDEITILANFHSNETYSTGGYVLSPEGFLATTPDNRVMADIFTNLFHGAALTPGEHFIAIDRTSATEITVRHPHGPDTPLRLPRPAAWTNKVFARCVLEDGSELLAPDWVSTSGSDLVLDCRQRTPGGSKISKFILFDAPLSANLPLYFLSEPLFELENETQTWVRVRASKPVTAVVQYGVNGGSSWAVTNHVFSYSQMSLVDLPILGTDYWFRVTITDAQANSVSSGTATYTALRSFWGDDFLTPKIHVSFDLGPYVEKDIVYNEGDAANDVFGDRPGDVHGFCEDGWSNGATRAAGLPANRIVRSTAQGLEYRLLPYSTANVIELCTWSNAPAESYVLDAPVTARYARIGILAASVGGDATFTILLRYADGTVATSTWEAADWRQPAATNVAFVFTNLNHVVAADGTIQGAAEHRLCEYVLDSNRGLDSTRDLAGVTIANRPLYGPAATNAYAAIFAVSGYEITSGWRDDYNHDGPWPWNARLYTSNGWGVVTADAALWQSTNYGKVLSGILQADLVQFPILEVFVPKTEMWGRSWWVLSLQDQDPPYSRVQLFEDRQLGTGRLILNIPEMTGWSGHKKFAVEFGIYNTEMAEQHLFIDYVHLRRDTSVGWGDGFAPPLDSWITEGNSPGTHAWLIDNHNGTATLAQDGHAQGWGAAYSERVVMDLGDYPWLNVRVAGITNPAEGAHFKVNVNDQLGPAYQQVIPARYAPFEDSGRVDKFGTNALDQFRVAMVIGGSNQLAVVDYVEFGKRGPTAGRLVWDSETASLKAGLGEAIWLALTATDADGNPIHYSHRGLPPAATYDGILRWTAPTAAGTYRFDVLASSDGRIVTSRVSVTVVDSTIQHEAPAWEAPWKAVATGAVTLAGTYVPETTNLLVEVSVNGDPYSTAGVTQSLDSFTWSGTVSSSPVTLDARVRDTDTSKLSSADRCTLYSTILGPGFRHAPAVMMRDATSAWVLVKSPTQVAAEVRYGIGAMYLAATSAALSLTHALPLPDLSPADPYSYQVIITDGAGDARISGVQALPAAGAHWVEEFDGEPAGWGEYLGASITASNGQGIMVFEATTSTWAKVLSPALDVDVDQFPVLEISIAEPSLWPGAYEIGLQEMEGDWTYVSLANNHLPGTIIANIPRLSGWGGRKKFAVEIRIYKDLLDTKRLFINYVELRSAANVAWSEEFNPPRTTWGYAYNALLTNIGGGTATLRQSGGSEGWGWLFSELIVADSREYPWMRAGVTAMDMGANFKGVIKDEWRTNYVTAIDRWDTSFTASGRFGIPRAGVSRLDVLRAGLAIAGAGADAVVDSVELVKLAPGATLAWDPVSASYKSGPSAALSLPLTATEYGGSPIQYSAQHLPQGAVYDGYLRWTTPTSAPGTYWIDFVAGNGRQAITNPVAVTVTNALIQLEAPRWDRSWLVADTATARVSGAYLQENPNVILQVSVNGGAYGTAGVTQVNNVFSWQGLVTASPITLDARLVDTNATVFSSSERSEVYSTLWGPTFLSDPVVEVRDATSVWVLVRASTQITATVHYGTTGPFGSSVSNIVPSYTHALLVTDLTPGQGYWFQAEISYGDGHKMLSPEIYYPAGGVRWADDFDADAGAWRDETTDPGFYGMLTVAGGRGTITVPGVTGGGNRYGKILSESVDVDLDQCPILEISLTTTNMADANYMVAVQDEMPPWPKKDLLMENREGPATLLLNIPKLTGWSGTKTISIEIAIENWSTEVRSLDVDRVVLRADGNLAWADEFAPLRTNSWGDQYFATLQDNADGSAKLRQTGGPGWGQVRSEMIAFDAGDYPWVAVRGTNIESGGHFLLNAYDCIASNTTALLDSWVAPFEKSAILPNSTNTVDRLKMTLVIENLNGSADLDYIRILRAVPGRALRWDSDNAVFDVPGYADVALPFTGTDYDGGTVYYTAVSLPPGCTYDGILRWRTSPRPGTNYVTLVASNGTMVITNTIALRVEPVPFECAGRADTNGSFLVSWEAISGETYRVLYKMDLRDPVDWAPLGPDVVATSAAAFKADPTIATSTQRYYQIRQVWTW